MLHHIPFLFAHAAKHAAVGHAAHASAAVAGKAAASKAVVGHSAAIGAAKGAGAVKLASTGPIAKVVTGGAAIKSSAIKAAASTVSSAS